jgi:ABC-type sugar transport system permease subunit
MYNTALMKVIVMIIITILLNALCQGGMGIISWIIVFIPFIFMSTIVFILLYSFGLDPATGKMNVICSNCDTQQKHVTTGNLIYSRQETKKQNPSNFIDITYSETPYAIDTPDEVNHYNYTTDPEQI